MTGFTLVSPRVTLRRREGRDAFVRTVMAKIKYIMTLSANSYIHILLPVTSALANLSQADVDISLKNILNDLLRR